jgi:hypothetical protein
MKVAQLPKNRGTEHLARQHHARLLDTDRLRRYINCH